MLARQKTILCLLAPILICGQAATAADSAVVFMYHHVATDTPASTSVTPERFREHMAYLEHGNFNVLPLMELVQRLRDGVDVPERSVALTFDDGYASVLSAAVPELENRGWPFTVFVTTEYVDSGYGGYMSWSELRELVARGATIGNHSRTHAHLVRRDTPGETPVMHRERVRQEIVEAGARIEAELGSAAAIQAFAYPYGEYDADVVAVVDSLQLVGFGQQSGAVGPRSDWLALPRFPVATGYDSLETFALRTQTRPLYLEVDSPYKTLNDNADNRPTFTARVPPGLPRLGELACYVGGQASAPVVWSAGGNSQLTVGPLEPLRPGRTKVNCTVPDDSTPGGYLWFGKLWMTRLPNGNWYSE